MFSFFENRFRRAYSFCFLDKFSDGIPVEYVDSQGQVTKIPRVIWQPETVEMLEELEGDMHAATVTQVLIPVESLPSIDLEGEFIRDGEEWDIDSREGMGVDSSSKTQHVIHLIKRSILSLSASNKRLE